MSRTGSVTAPATSPEDGKPESDNLSNWGSVDDTNIIPVGGTTAARPRQRRLSGSSRRNPRAGGEASAGRKTRDESISKTGGPSTVFSGGAGDGYGNSVAPSSAMAVRSKVNGGGGSENRRPAWNSQSTAAKKTVGNHSSKAAKRGGPSGAAQEEVSAVSEYPAAVGTASTGRRKRRNSVGSTERGAKFASAAVSGGEDEEGQGFEAETAAPSQEDIRLMIERIRRDADDTTAAATAAVAGGRPTPSGGNGNMARFEQEAAIGKFASKVDRARGHPAAPISNKSSASTAHRRGVSTSSSTGVATAAAAAAMAGGADAGGVLGMNEIVEEERRLQEKASKLEMEISAVQRRRLEVHLVKVEQQLQEEAASRLLRRETKVRAEVERACKALQKEREERVGGVAAVKENLRGKLEQLSTMYEEVCTRMENLEQAYATADTQLRERANADQRKAIEREERGVHRRIRALMLEHGSGGGGGNAQGKGADSSAATAPAPSKSTGAEENSAERFLAQDEELLEAQEQEQEQPAVVKPLQQRNANGNRDAPTTAAARSNGVDPASSAGLEPSKKRTEKDRRRSAGSIGNGGGGAGVIAGTGVTRRRRRASVEGKI